jgi:hypothetical protein
MRLALPETVHRVPITQPERAIREYARIIGGLRDGAAADLEAIATEAVDTVRGEGAVLMAVVTPPDAAPALLTGVVLDVPAPWNGEIAELLRDSVQDVGGPDVRETIALDGKLGPVVIVQRIPGVEQARAGRPLTVQLQAFLPEPGTGRLLLLTLACPSLLGWSAHQELFAGLVVSASVTGNVASEDDSFEQHTYRLG